MWGCANEKMGSLANVLICADREQELRRVYDKLQINH